MLVLIPHYESWWNLLADVVVVGGGTWGLVAGLSVFYHKFQMRELANKIAPLFDAITDRMDAQETMLTKRLDAQDSVLQSVEHEVVFNNGSSVKDAVNRVEFNQIDDRKAHVKMAETVEKIDRDLSEHLGFHKGMVAGLKS